MHVQHQPLNGNIQYVFPATFVWGPKPASVASYRADDPGYYSDQDYWLSNGAAKVRYIFECSQGAYDIRALYTIDSGPPLYPGYVAITTYYIGLPGNTCMPFSLHNPRSLNNGFQLQGITIDGQADGIPPGRPSGAKPSNIVVPGSLFTPPY